MQITHAMQNGIQVYTFQGDLDVYHADIVHETLDTKWTNSLVIDVSGVDFIDSIGLAVLVQMLKRVRANNGNLCLCGLTSAVRTILHLTRLERAFRLYTDVDAALHDLQSTKA